LVCSPLCSGCGRTPSSRCFRMPHRASVHLAQYPMILAKY
jgi:hypothetical protein